MIQSFDPKLNSLEAQAKSGKIEITESVTTSHFACFFIFFHSKDFLFFVKKNKKIRSYVLWKSKLLLFVGVSAHIFFIAVFTNFVDVRWSDGWLKHKRVKVAKRYSRRISSFEAFLLNRHCFSLTNDTILVLKLLNMFSFSICCSLWSKFIHILNIICSLFIASHKL